MLAKKIINNNVVLCVDGGQEVLLMGKGIGFSHKESEKIDMEQIEKIFRPESNEISQKISSLLERNDEKFLNTAEEIINYAEKRMQTKLNEILYVLLTDHLAFAMCRFRKKITFTNPLLREIKILYREEYEIGRYSLKIIKKNLGISLPVAEAGFIALHIVNAKNESNIFDSLNSTELVHTLLTKISDYFLVKFDEGAVDYLRLITHLNFFAQKVMKKEEDDSEGDELTNLVISSYPKIAAFVGEVAEYIYERYDYAIPIKEHAYLILHLQRVL